MTDIVQIVQTDVEVIEVIASGPQGIQGVPGAAGAGAGTRQNTYTAGAVLSALRAVYLDSADKVQYADKDNATHMRALVGITLSSALLDAALTVLEAGYYTDAGWSWTPDAFVYVGANGVLTQTPPTTGYLAVVGFAATATVLYVQMRHPIALV